MIDIQVPFDIIIIIGNGFDLNLSLKTSYSDFVNSKYFDELATKKNKVCIALKERHNLHNWVDIENELKIIANSGNDVPENIFELEYNELCDYLCKYLLEINYGEINQNSHAYNFIKSFKNKQCLVLDFNYTETTRLLFSEIGMQEIDKRIIKVHGSAKSNDIIFGVEDSADIRWNHVFLKKSFHKLFKGINIESHIRDIKEVHIFGHSLGETDRMYFSTAFFDLTVLGSSRNGKKIFLYYYGHKGYTDLHKQLDQMTMKRLSALKQNNEFITIDVST